MVIEPGDARAVLLEGGFAKNRFVTAVIEGRYKAAVRRDFDRSAVLHELAVQQLRLCFFESLQLLCQPAVGAVGEHRQRHIQIDVQPDFTRQTIHVKEVDVCSQAVFDAVATGVVRASALEKGGLFRVVGFLPNVLPKLGDKLSE